MGLRDYIASDIKSIMDTSEFADSFQVNGVSITAIEDGDNLIRRIQSDYGGMAIGDLLLHVAEDEWAKVPKVSHPPVQGEVVTVGKKPAVIFTCSYSEGMLDIIFQYRRS